VHEAYQLNPLFVTFEASMEDKEVMAKFDLVYLSPGLHLLSNIEFFYILKNILHNKKFFVFLSLRIYDENRR